MQDDGLKCVGKASWFALSSRDFAHDATVDVALESTLLKDEADLLKAVDWVIRRGADWVIARTRVPPRRKEQQ